MDEKQLEIRLGQLEERLYGLERLIYGQVLLGERIKVIENMIEAEAYESARQEIAGLIRYLGDVPELHGLIARIDIIEFFKDSEEST